ncbi:IS30 family transposase [Rubripirellula reticaptiva]|uniref:Integrase core domain protein n=1 Tax=Rubripirellula reticaptiva TaxID=2528013 RepID=A0A5C6EQJ3_9BACT|nr:IS30 family transposase [Rubripirellula reticaptiva]TWU52053.1 Integrase core domain protein [Rubripirellula reticaptiva]
MRLKGEPLEANCLVFNPQAPANERPAMRHLNYVDRANIQFLLGRGHSPAAIARKLDRHRSTIGREIKRNSSCHRSYDAGCAQRTVKRRRLDSAPRPKRNDVALMEHVHSKLAMNWSPAQIAGHLKKSVCQSSVSHQTIYNYLGDLDKDHPHRLAMRRRGRRNRNAPPGFVANKHKHGLSIHERLAIINRRGRLGDWEVDLMTCAKTSGYLITAVDRRSGYTLIRRVSDKTAGRVAEGIIKMFEGIDPKKVLSMTFDNGVEFTYTRKIAKALGVRIYFCDPYNSGQRGTNENTNGLIRQYFPKHLHYGYISYQAVQKAITALNNRPRLRLQFRTPANTFERRPNVAFRI